MKKPDWWVIGSIAFMVLTIAGSIWFAVALTDYIFNGGLAHDSGHFVKEFKQASK